MNKILYYDLFFINKSNNLINIKKNFFILINYIISNNGIILKVEFCGEKKFFYPIKKNIRGYYIIIFFYSYSNILNKIYHFFKKNDNILRYLIIKFKYNNNYITNN
ncbi:30S ribosomal protein S6 [Candidatus Nasuia deltocephalinicola]|nr:30S ribosomal protein S6 [Candidatus Nasuia deltocephalinicola]